MNSRFVNYHNSRCVPNLVEVRCHRKLMTLDRIIPLEVRILCQFALALSGIAMVPLLLQLGGRVLESGEKLLHV